MRIESKHNPTIFKTENIERWDRLYKEKVIRHYIYLTASILFLFTAIYLIKNKNPTGYIFFSIGLFGLVVSINYLSHVKREKREYISKISKISERHIMSNAPFFWEFEDDYVLYHDFQMTLKIKWDAFSHYYIKHNAIYLIMKDTNDSPISINKSEVNEVEFFNLTKFIDGKLKNN